MTLGAFAKHLENAFRNPSDPSLVLLNETCVVLLEPLNKPKLFPIDMGVANNIVSLEEVLNSAFVAITKNSSTLSHNCIVAVGVSYSLSHISQSLNPASLDLTLERSNRTASSEYAISTLKSLPDTVLEEALDSEVLACINRVAANCNVSIVGLTTLAELTLNCLNSTLESDKSILVTWPTESLLVRRTNSDIAIISDTSVSSADSNNSSALNQFASEAVSYSEFDLSPSNTLNSGAGWANRLSSIAAQKTQHKLERVMPRLTRVAAALIVTLGALGLWQSETLGESRQQSQNYSQLVQARNDLRSQNASLTKNAGTAEIIPGLTVTSFLGRLGQERVEGVQLSQAHISAIAGATEVSVSGIAENEAQVFRYIETLETHFPDISISLENMSMRHVNNRTTQSTSTNFELRFTR